MTAEECRHERDAVKHKTTNEGSATKALWEIAAQLAELNEKQARITQAIEV